MVMSWILNSFREEIDGVIYHHDMAAGMWKKFKRTIFTSEPCARDQEGDCQWPSRRYAKMWNLWEHLTGVAQTHKDDWMGCTSGVTAKENEDEKLHQFFMWLNQAYHIVRSNLLCRDLLPSFSNAFFFSSRWRNSDRSTTN